MAARPAVDGAVLAGGASRRMGRDKASLALGGAPLAARVARALAEVCGTVWLVGGDPPAETPGRRVTDPEGPRCALRGLVAALEASDAPDVLVVATDLPLVTPRLLDALARAGPADAVVPRDAGGLHPLCARYRRASVLPVARAWAERTSRCAACWPACTCASWRETRCGAWTRRARRCST